MNRTIVLLCAIFGLVGLGLLGVAGYLASSTIRFRSQSKAGQGVVVRLIETRDNDGDRLHKPEVEWTDESGATHKFAGSVASSPPAFSTGDRVTVLYLPGQPNTARIDSFSDMWLGPVAFGGFGAVFALVTAGFGIHALRKNSQRNWLTVFGRRIEASIVGIAANANITVMNRHPWIITAQWLDPATNTVHMFRSDSIWFDPTPYVNSQTIEVLIDPHNPKRYHVETGFLPKQAR